MARRPGEDLTTLSDNGFFGFGVDGGMGCFYDSACSIADMLTFDIMNPDAEH